jgi:hypothetical protein
MMSSKTAIVLRNSLITLGLGALASAAWAADPPAAPTAKFTVAVKPADQPPTPRVLDLKAPDIRTVMSADELNAALAVPDETEALEPETVAVHGAVPAPYVPGGFAALYWAANHPADSWRILTPVQ